MQQTALFLKDIQLLPYDAKYDVQTISWLNAPDIKRTFGLNRIITLHEHIEWIQVQKQYLLWAIVGDNNVHYGNVSLRINSQNKSAYFQIYVGNIQSRNRGIGWNSLMCVVNYAFNNLGLNRIWLHVFPDNIAAIKLYTKAGFIQEGRERGAILREGEFFDQLVWSLLKNDWKNE